jgi:hypothetical protein
MRKLRAVYSRVMLTAIQFRTCFSSRLLSKNVKNQDMQNYYFARGFVWVLNLVLGRTEGT